uniref:Uncharacterized protein n=1 Tax=Myripristis murdjan TaxID=586833 RepID=A0A667ZNV2_9TELE
DLGGGTAIPKTPEMERVKLTQQHISTVLCRYKDALGQGTAIPDLPEVKRVQQTQKNISSLQYKGELGQGTAVSDTPEIDRVKRNQRNISTVHIRVTILFFYNRGPGCSTGFTRMTHSIGPISKTLIKLIPTMKTTSSPFRL